MRTKYVLCLAIFNMLVGGLAFGQTQSETSPKKGVEPTGSYLLSDIETFSETNGNVTLAIPLGALGPDRAGRSQALSLIYNSKIWERSIQSTIIGGTSVDVNGVDPSPDGGWQYGIGYQLQQDARDIVYYIPPTCSADCDLMKYYYKAWITFPDGSRHLLRLQGYPDYQGDGHYAYGFDGQLNCTAFANDPQCNSQTRNRGSFIYYTTDGTFARLEVRQADGNGNFYNKGENNPWTLYFRDGSRVEGGDDPTTGNYRPQRICDRNDNCVSVEYAVRQVNGVNIRPTYFTAITDDFGRQIQITYGGEFHTSGYATSDTIVVPGYQDTLTWTVDWDWLPRPRPEYNCQAADGSGQWGTCTADVLQLSVTEIHVPTQSGLNPFQFSYNGRFSELSQLTLPSGGTATYTYNLDVGAGCPSSPTGLPDAQDILANYPCRKQLVYLDEYLSGTSLSEVPTTEVTALDFPKTINQYGATLYDHSVLTAPDGGVTTTYFNWVDYYGPGQWNTGLVYRINHPDGSRTHKVWAQNPLYLNSFLYDKNNAYVRYEITYLPESSSQYGAVKEFRHDRNGNVLQTTEYDWTAWSAFQLDGSGEPTGVVSPPAPVLRTTASTYSNPTQDATMPPTQNEGNVYWNSTAPRLLSLVASTAVREATGVVASRSDYCYDANGNVRFHGQLKAPDTGGSIVDCASGQPAANAIVTQYSYGTSGILTSTTDPRGVTTTLQYDGNSLYVTDKLEAGNTAEARHWSYVTDSITGKVTATTDVDNSTQTTSTYDAFGRPRVVTDPAKTVEITYGDAGRYRKTTSTLDGTRNIDAVEHFNQRGDVSIRRQSDTGALDPAQPSQGIVVETHTLYTANGKYVFTSTPHRQAPAPDDPPTGWAREQYDSMGRLVVRGNFEGAFRAPPLSQLQDRPSATSAGSRRSWTRPQTRHPVQIPAGRRLSRRMPRDESKKSWMAQVQLLTHIMRSAI